MKKQHNIFYFLLVITILFFSQCQQSVEKNKKQNVHSEEEEHKKDPKFFEQLNKMLRDPATGEIPAHRILEAKKIADRKRNNTSTFREIPFNWEERGPTNIGGRTRCFLFDERDDTRQTVFLGSTSGGLWKTTQFDSPNPNWISIDDFFGNLSISSIVQDPIHLDVFYFSTGEPFGNGGRGLGIWKSEDGGNTWNQLPSTNNSNFHQVNRLVIDDSANLYAALLSDGIHQSTDGGNTWQKVLGDPNVICYDIEVASNGTIYAHLRNGIFKSTDHGANWTSISSNITSSHLQPRGDMVSQFSNPDVVLIYLCSSNLLYKTTDGGANWNAIEVPILGSQCYWDVTVGIHPTDENTFLVGETSLVYTKDNGQQWIYASNIHVDHHVSYFDPQRPGYVVNCNDGGIYGGFIQESNNNFTLANKNDNYNVTQFYTGTLHPDPVSNIMLGGTQDNGTQLFQNTGLNFTTWYSGGDGAYCVIDDNEPNIWITSFQNGVYQISNDAGATRQTYNTGGGFIDPAIYDSQSNSLYSGAASGTYSLIRDVGGANHSETRTVPTASSSFSSFANSPTISNRVYMGTYTGKLYRVDNANAAQITSNSLINNNQITGTVRGISIEKGNEDHIIITISNYGPPHVWETTNGGTNWEDISGDLPDIPTWDGMFAPDNPDQFIIATELGIWTTENIDGSNTIWQPSNNGLANVRVFQLHKRKADNTLLAATYGRGFYTSDFYTNLIGATDLELNLSTSTPSPEPNIPFDITISVQNTGYIDATNVAVSALLPDGFTLNNQNPQQGTYNSNTGLWTIGTVPKGTTLTLTLNLQFSITEISFFLAQVSQMDQDDFDSEPDNNTGGFAIEDDEDNFIFNSDGSIVDLELSLNIGTSVFMPGEKGTLSFVLKNNSSFDADNITIQLPIDNKFIYVLSNDPNFDAINHIYHFNTVLGNETKAANLDIVYTNLFTESLVLFSQILTQTQADIDSSPGNNNGNTPNEDDEASLGITPVSLDPCTRDWTITYQEQIDHFPPCTILDGGLTIEGVHISSLAGLSNLVEIKKTLVFLNTTQLSDLQGLNNLVTIGETLALPSNTGLTSLGGLDNLTSIGGFWYMGENPNLTHLGGLTNLTTVGEGFQISGNNSLENIDELSNLQSTPSIEVGNNPQLKNVDGFIGLQSITGNVIFYGNDALENYNGLANLNSVGGVFVSSESNALVNLNGLQNLTEVGNSVYITANESLQSLDGFGNLQSIGGELFINQNPMLTDCCAFYDFLNSPASDTININITENPSDCSSPSEIIENCEIIGGNIDLELNLVADVSTPPIYSYVNYTLTITNKGPQTATNIEIIFPKPDGLAFDDQTVSQGIYFHFGNGTWDVGSLAANQSATLTLKLFTLTSNPITSYAQVTNATETDLDSSPNNGNPPTPNEDDEAAVTINGDIEEDCNITNTNATTICFDQGTTQPEDDRFKIFLNPTGSDLSSNYTVSGDINQSDIPYGSAQQIGNDYLIADGALNITITDASGNCSIGPFTINPPTPCSDNADLPDLQLANLQLATSSGEVGELINYTFDLINAGTIPASGNYPINLVLSTDQAYDSGDAFAGVINTGNTPVGTIPNVQGAITVPNLNAGNYFLIMFADPNGNIDELNENNNILVTPFIINGDGGDCTNTTNLALNKNTEQSTTLIANGITGAADKAVDGNTNGVFFTNNSSVSATQNENQAWWQVDLGESATIEDILVYNRTDGTDKTHDFYVLVSDTPFGTASLDEAQFQAKFEQFTNGLAASPTSITINRTGRYVRVQMQGTGHLTLAELEVIGCTDTQTDCSVTVNTSNLRCDDNGTSDANDDLFYFDVNVSTTGDETQGWEMCTSFDNGNCNNTATGNFNNITTIGPLQLADFPTGIFNTTVSNLAESNCSKTISIHLPEPCSIDGTEGADLELSMTVDQSEYVIYENYIYTVTISNTGDETANNITVQVPEPDGMAYTSSNAAQGEYFPWGDFLWTVGSLDAGASTTLEILWFTLVEDKNITAYAQVFTASPDDPDSTPGNGIEPIVSEDDETNIVLSPSGVLIRSGAYEEQKLSVNGVRVYRVYPNPAREKVTIQVLSSLQGKVLLEIFDIKAQRIISQDFDLIKGSNKLELQTLNLAAGLYHVILKPQEGKTKMTKFLVQ